MVVCGAVPAEAGRSTYLDELSPLGPTTIAEFYQERGADLLNAARRSTFPLQPAMLADLRGGDREVNADNHPAASCKARSAARNGMRFC